MHNLPSSRRLGIISDTHGLLRPEALAFLRGADRIIHGGDIGGAEVIAQLSGVAPVTVVRGNNDKGAWADKLPEFALVDFHGASIYVLHDLSQLDLDPSAAKINAVVSGHSHKPLVEQRDGILYINPGSAGPRRFRLPVAVGEILVDGGGMSARIVELEVAPARSRRA
jgi:putative phosphoesterase